MGNQKNKGNAFERTISNDLSCWFFNQKGVLWREPTSGARKKNAYRGDIIPANVEVFSKYWKCWPFIIECKHGYKNQIATFSNQTKVRIWLKKLMDERCNAQQIPMLIIQFHARSKILITNYMLNTWCDISMAMIHNDITQIFYIYDFAILLKLNFYNIFDKRQLSEFVKQQQQHNS